MNEPQGATSSTGSASTGKHVDPSKPVDSFSGYDWHYQPKHRRYGPARTPLVPKNMISDRWYPR